MTTNQDRVLPTADDFEVATTQSVQKRHWKTRDRYRLTLCGQLAVFPVVFQQELEAFAALPPCKQCDKSKARRIEGRKS